MCHSPGEEKTHLWRDVLPSILKAHSDSGSQGDSGLIGPYLFWNSDLRSAVALPIHLLYQITFGCIVCRQHPVNMQESYTGLSHRFTTQWTNFHMQSKDIVKHFILCVMIT